jgi:hypothetical protein
MECGSEFLVLVSRNRFIQDLEGQGYLLDFVGGYFLIYGLPYLNEQGGLEHGDWVSPVDLVDGVLGPPTNHQAWFRGGAPHDQAGRRLNLGGGLDRVKVAGDFETDRSFSYKLKDPAGQLRRYLTFEEKVRTYVDSITGPALAAYPHATPLRAIEVKAAEQNTPLRYPDTLSSKYNVNDLSKKLEGKSVAIVGLGGTGSYILDFISRTHLAKIALFDDDTVDLATIFRFPGFIANVIGSPKVDALFKQYSNWHSSITPFAERVTETNIANLRGFDFVFLAIDHGPSRLLIIDWLSANGIPFVDCGMGLNRAPAGLNGVVRVTGVDRSSYDATTGTAFLPGGDPEGGEYRKQGQIAEMNSLNAALAVVRFKQHFGIYYRLDDATSIILETSTFDIDRPTRAA